MPRRVAAALVAVLITFLAAPAASALPAGAADALAPAAVTPAAVTPPTDPPVAVDNPFIPEGNLGDCVSAVPKPNCGTSAKGGWHQNLVLGALVLGLSFIGWRIVKAVRSTRRELESQAGR